MTSEFGKEIYYIMLGLGIYFSIRSILILRIFLYTKFYVILALCIGDMNFSLACFYNFLCNILLIESDIIFWLFIFLAVLSYIFAYWLEKEEKSLAFLEEKNIKLRLFPIVKKSTLLLLKEERKENLFNLGEIFKKFLSFKFLYSTLKICTFCFLSILSIILLYESFEKLWGIFNLKVHFKIMDIKMKQISFLLPFILALLVGLFSAMYSCLLYKKWQQSKSLMNFFLASFLLLLALISFQVLYIGQEGVNIYDFGYWRACAMGILMILIIIALFAKFI